MACLKDFLNQNKIMFHFAPLLNDYRSGKTDFNPIAVEIHPTSKCNHRCIHCSYKERNEKRLELNSDVMDKLIASVINMGVKAVYFSGGGEPTVYPGISKHVETLYNSGVEVSLITNGTYLEEAGIIDIAHMFNYIAVSVPSVSGETFEYITKSRKLDKALDVATAIKSKHGKKAPVIGARVVVTSVIYKETLTILDVLRKNQYDYVLFKIARDYEGRGLGIGDEEERYLKEFIASSEFDASFTNLSGIFEYRRLDLKGEKCIVNDLGMIANVDSDGKVYPNIVEIGDKDFCVGDLNKSSLEEIWSSNTHLRVKELSHSKWRSKECSNCRAIAYNNIIYRILDELPCDYDVFI